MESNKGFFRGSTWWPWFVCLTSWWQLKIFFMFTPNLGGRWNQFWRSYFFQRGWKNQLVKFLFPTFSSPPQSKHKSTPSWCLIKKNMVKSTWLTVPKKVGKLIQGGNINKKHICIYYIYIYTYRMLTVPSTFKPWCIHHVWCVPFILSRGPSILATFVAPRTVFRAPGSRTSRPTWSSLAETNKSQEKIGFPSSFWCETI